MTYQTLAAALLAFLALPGCDSSAGQGSADAAGPRRPAAPCTSDAAPSVPAPGRGCPAMSDAGARTFVEHRAPIDSATIYAGEWPGAEPTVVLMHGFPDNLHLYDRLVPELSCRRVVAFDFLGWGESDKPAGRKYTAETQAGDIDAVLTYFALSRAVLVVHDASGPPGIRWALAHPERVDSLVLLNTYYSITPSQHPPEAITIFSQTDLQPLEDSIFARPD